VTALTPLAADLEAARWPDFMSRFGDVFGVPFAIDGIFLDEEAS
jgi:hypothetical protein